MKIKLEEALDFLKQIGVDVELAEGEEASDYDQSQFLSLVDASRRTILQPLIESELKDGIQTSIAGKVGGILERELVQQTGISARELQGMTDKEKIAKAISHKISLLDSDKEEVSKRIDEILLSHKAEVESLKSDYEGKLSNATQKYIDRDIKAVIMDVLRDKINIPKESSPSVLADDIMNDAKMKHYLKYDESERKVGFYNKDNNDMPSLNEAKNAMIDVESFIYDYLKPRGILFNDNRNVNPQDAMSGGVPAQGSAPQPQKKKMLLGNGEDQVAATMNMVSRLLGSAE